MSPNLWQKYLTMRNFFKMAFWPLSCCYSWLAINKANHKQKSLAFEVIIDKTKACSWCYSWPVYFQHQSVITVVYIVCRDIAIVHHSNSGLNCPHTPQGFIEKVPSLSSISQLHWVQTNTNQILLELLHIISTQLENPRLAFIVKAETGNGTV